DGDGVLFEVARLPVAGPDVLVGFDHAARHSQHQGPGEVGGGFVENAGSIGDQDAAAGAGGDVDVVVAHSDVRDDTKLGGGAKRVVADALGEQADQAFFVL